jgi:hypothetical protein
MLTLILVLVLTRLSLARRLRIWTSGAATRVSVLAQTPGINTHCRLLLFHGCWRQQKLSVGCSHA